VVVIDWYQYLLTEISEGEAGSVKEFVQSSPTSKYMTVGCTWLYECRISPTDFRKMGDRKERRTSGYRNRKFKALV
jgi:hypothetical protein